MLVFSESPACLTNVLSFHYNIFYCIICIYKYIYIYSHFMNVCLFAVVERRFKRREKINNLAVQCQNV